MNGGDWMSIKKMLNEKFSELKNEREMSLFLNEVITFLHDTNEQCFKELSETGLFSKDRLSLRFAGVDNGLKQAVETIKENIKIVGLSKKNKEISEIKLECNDLKNKINRAQLLIDEAKEETVKTKRKVFMETKNKLQITRDKLVAVANTSKSLGEQINDKCSKDEVEDTLNNIVMNVGLIVDELVMLELWNEDEEKPSISKIKLKKAPRSTKKTTTRKKTAAKKKEAQDDGSEQNNDKKNADDEKNADDKKNADDENIKSNLGG